MFIRTSDDGVGTQSLLDSFKTISKVKDRDGGHPLYSLFDRKVSVLLRTLHVTFPPFELIIIIKLMVRLRH